MQFIGLGHLFVPYAILSICRDERLCLAQEYREMKWGLKTSATPAFVEIMNRPSSLKFLINYCDYFPSSERNVRPCRRMSYDFCSILYCIFSLT